MDTQCTFSFAVASHARFFCSKLQNYFASESGENSGSNPTRARSGLGTIKELVHKQNPSQPVSEMEQEQQQLAVDGDDMVGGDRSKETEERKKQRAYANVFVCSLSLLLAGTMALMLLSHGGAPLWLASELAAVLCLLLYLWAYQVTQNLTTGAAVPVEALVFAFPLVFGAGFLAALLAVAVAPIAGVLVMGADVACVSAFFGFCLAEYVRSRRMQPLTDSAASARVET
ncbi:hypothetical protein E2562_008210 [Oryza meyeriana var. granulata]|uniref:Uncharacterized protein n=1 Tax=Oryza meyeriana var. granulata TaxID=110450 RepID=A0A6G1CFV2_9ORYZ|nr:hypothetical protein E2562_008210 [Oryza meyeriana var. granulata]